MPITRKKTLTVAMLFLVACASTRTTSTATQTEALRSGTSLDQSETSAEPSDELYGPPSLKSQGIVLVLGPGLARSLSAVGVLQILHEYKIPIRAIYASELSGLVALSYSTSKTPSEMDWKLLRFGPSAFPLAKKGWMSWVGKVSSRSIEKSISQAFSSMDLSETVIPTFLCGQHGVKFHCFNQGPLRKILQGCLENPSLQSAPVELDGERFSGVVDGQGYAISSARERYQGPIVVIDVIAARGAISPQGLEKESEERLRKMRELSLSAIKDADLVLAPSLEDIGFLDFQRREEIIFRGKKAATLFLDHLRSLAGSQ